MIICEFKKGSCSVSCGGGFWVKTRICRFPPCTDSGISLSDKRCNTQNCPDEQRSDCFHENGLMYRGQVSELVTRRRSQPSKFEKWHSSQTTDFIVSLGQGEHMFIFIILIKKNI